MDNGYKLSLSVETPGQSCASRLQLVIYYVVNRQHGGDTAALH